MTRTAVCFRKRLQIWFQRKSTENSLVWSLHFCSSFLPTLIIYPFIVLHEMCDNKTIHFTHHLFGPIITGVHLTIVTKRLFENYSFTVLRSYQGCIKAKNETLITWQSCQNHLICVDLSTLSILY